MNRQHAQRNRKIIDRGLPLLVVAAVALLAFLSGGGPKVGPGETAPAQLEIRWELRRLIQAQEHYYHRRQEQRPDRPAGYAPLSALVQSEYYSRPDHINIDNLRASHGKFFVRISHSDQPVRCELEFIHDRLHPEQAIEQAECSSTTPPNPGGSP